MNSERGALVGGSDPPSDHSVHHTAGYFVAGAGQASDKKIFVHGCVENRRQKVSISPRWQTNIPFFQVWEKSVGRRGRPLAS